MANKIIDKLHRVVTRPINILSGALLLFILAMTLAG